MEIRLTCTKLFVMQKTNYQFDCEWVNHCVYTHAWDQLVLNHANSKNIVFQRFAGFLIHPV
jgi:hypothetical protein